MFEGQNNMRLAHAQRRTVNQAVDEIDCLLKFVQLCVKQDQSTAVHHIGGIHVQMESVADVKALAVVLQRFS